MLPESLLENIHNISSIRRYGKVVGVKGLRIEVAGLNDYISIGSKCQIILANGQKIDAEVTALKEKISYMIPYEDADGIAIGLNVCLISGDNQIYPDVSWLGRVIDAKGNPIDGKGPLIKGNQGYLLKAKALPAHERDLVGEKLDLGVKAINTFLSCCKGQRMGIFAGSGVGKSVLISMITKYSLADVKIIGLIGERGREVQEFLHEYLGEEGLKQAIVVVATGDQSAPLRKQAAYMTMALAEYFRDLSNQVICVIDSITRFAMAQREIGLASGEPPTTKGYTPTVFSELPKLLERAGPGLRGSGAITGLFSVLVEGDDHNEPISDAVRGILDGHIVLSRNIAARQRFPAIDILSSISRMLPKANNDYENKLITEAKKLMSDYSDMEEMIKIGAYRKGANENIDRAIFYVPKIEEFLHQVPNAQISMGEGYRMLEEILNIPFNK